MPTGHPLIRFLLICALLVPACARAPEESAPSEPPASEGLLAINGTEIFVERLGRGEPVIVVHGGPMLEHGYLLPHLAPLADDYELILADQRLSGRSAGEVAIDSVRLSTFVADIEALRQELELGPCHLMAHSWGGLLALHYALDHPENQRSLTLLGPMSASSDLWQREQQAMAAGVDPADQEARQAILESEAFAAADPQAIEALLRLSFKPQFHDPSRLAELQLYVPEDYMARSRQFGNLMVDLTSYDLHERLAQIEVPTLIIYGADEPGLEIGGRALADAIPGSTLVAIDEAGHFPFIERPEEFFSAVRDFLDSASGDSG